jgi:hypothetical protein
MKIPFYISVSASGLSLILSVVLFLVGGNNQGLQGEIQKQQAELQKQQEQINTGNAISQKVGPELLRDMAISSIKDEKMKMLLAKHGYNVATPTPTPGAASPAPAAPAASPAPASSSAPAATPTLRP